MKKGDIWWADLPSPLAESLLRYYPVMRLIRYVMR